MRRSRLQFAGTAQPVDHRCRFAVQRLHQVALGVCGRFGNDDAGLRQVLHQPQIKRQLLKIQALKHRQHIFALVGAGEVVGVFDAAGAAFECGEAAQLERGQEFGCLRKRNFCVNRHGMCLRKRAEGWWGVSAEL